MQYLPLLMSKGALAKAPALCGRLATALCGRLASALCGRLATANYQQMKCLFVRQRKYSDFVTPVRVERYIETETHCAQI